MTTTTTPDISAAVYTMQCPGGCLTDWMATHPQPQEMADCPDITTGEYCRCANNGLEVLYEHGAKHAAAAHSWTLAMDTRPDSPAYGVGVKYDAGRGEWIPARLRCALCGHTL